MVDIKLTPRDFSKRSGGIGVPQQGSVPSLRNLPSVRDVGTEAQADALISMADDGLRLQALAGEQFDLHMREVKADQAIEAEKVYANSLVGISAGVENIRQTEELTEAIPGKTLDFYDKSSQQVLEKTQGLSSYQRQVLGDKFNQYRTNVAGQAIQYQANLRAVERENDVAEILQSTSLYLYNNPGQLDIRMGELGATLRDAGLSTTEVESQILKARGKLASDAIKGGIAKNPGQTLNAINNGVYDVYLDGANKAQLAKYAESQIKQADTSMSIDQMKAFGEFKANFKNDPTAYTDDDIVNAAQQFNLKPNQIVDMFEEREAGTFAKDEKIADTNFMLSALDGQTQFNPYDKTHAKKADNFYEEIVGPEFRNQILAGNVDQAQIAVTDLIDKTGYLPEALKNDVLGIVANGNLEQRVSGAQLVGRIQEARRGSPDGKNIDFGFSPEQQAMVDTIISTTRFETDPEKAIQRVEERLRIDPAVRQTRATEANKIIADIEKDTSIDTLMAEEFDGWFRSQASVLPETKGRITQQFKDKFNQYYIGNPDGDKAKKYAMEAIKQTLGETNITGSKKLMEYAPEKIMPDIMGSYDYIYDDFNNTFKEYIDKGWEIELVGGELTRMTAQPDIIRATGLAPSYGVIAYDEFGDMQAIRKDNGDIMDYRLPMPSQQLKAEAVAKKVEEFKSTRQSLKNRDFEFQNIMKDFISGVPIGTGGN